MPDTDTLDVAEEIIEPQIIDTPSQDAKDPAAATSEAADEPKSTASIVRDVVAKRQAGEAEKAASSAEGVKQVDGQSTPAERDPDDYTDVPFHKHPRFREVTGKLRTARAEVEQLKPDAERYQNVQTFLDNNGLSSEEAADALLTFALAKSNPTKAWEMVKPWVAQLAQAAGEVLPQELQDRVAAGEITRELAFEIARSQATAKSVQTHSEFERKRREQAEATATVNSVVNAADDWVNDRKVKDPNYAAKEALLQAGLASIHQREGVARTREKAVEQLNAAYKFANDHFRAAKPAQTVTPIKPVTGSATVAAGAVAQEPDDTAGIIRAHLARARAAG